jgi:hypothetical protein
MTKLRYKIPEFIIYIDNLQRQVSWILGQAAFRMIKVTKSKSE